MALAIPLAENIFKILERKMNPSDIETLKTIFILALIASQMVMIYSIGQVREKHARLDRRRSILRGMVKDD